MHTIRHSGTNRAGASPSAAARAASRRGVWLAACAIAVVCSAALPLFAQDAPADKASPADANPVPAEAVPRPDAKTSPDAKASPGAALLPSDIIAVVNGEELTRGAFRAYLERAMGSSYLDIYVNEVLIEQRAKARGVVSTPEAEAGWIEERILQVKAAPEYRQMGTIDYDELRHQYKRQARMGYLLVSLIKADRQGDAAVQRLFDQRYGERRKARHILYAVRPPAGATEATQEALDQEAKKKAQRAVEMLAKGVEFSDLAKRESQDPGSAGRGGALPAFGRGDMVPEFAEAAFGAEKGKVTGPVRSPFGWHVMQVTEVYPAQKELDDTLRAELKAEIIKLPVAQQEVNAYLQRLRAEAEVELRFDVGLRLNKEAPGR